MIKERGSKQLYINMFANIVSYIGTILISFVLTPYLINSLGKETYSFYPIANNIVNYMAIVVNALNAVANRFITIEIVNKRKENVISYFSTSFYLNIIMCLILSLPMVLIVIFIDNILNVPINSLASIRVLFALVFSSMIINISTSTFGVATYATNRVDLRSVRELLAAVFRIILYVVIFTFFSPSIVYVGVVAVIIALFNLLVQKYYTKTLLPEIKIQKSKFSSAFFREIISPSVWNIINQLGNMLLSGTTMIIANVLYGASVGADYSIVHTVPSLINGVITMLVSVFMPLIMQYYAIGNREKVIGQTIKAQKVVGIISCSVISVFIILCDAFFELWVPLENAKELQRLSVITIIPHLFLAPVWPVSNLNIIINKLKTPAVYLAVSGASNIILVYLLYLFEPANKYWPALVSSILQLIWVGIFVPIYPCKYLLVKKGTFIAILPRMVVASGISLLLTGIIRRMFCINSWFGLIFCGFLCGGVALVIHTIIFFNLMEIVEFIKKIVNLGRKK